MFIVIFRSRLNPGVEAEYQQRAGLMAELVQKVPGYVSHKSYTAADGERVTIAEFSSESALREWATHPEHVEAKKKGRSSFYAEYQVQVCSLVRANRFP